MEKLNFNQTTQKRLSKLFQHKYTDSFEMFHKIDEFLSIFKNNLQAANHYACFIMTIMGKILATDQMGGKTPIMRGLQCDTDYIYYRLRRFERSPKLSLTRLRDTWIKNAPLLFEFKRLVDGTLITAADHTIVSVDGKKIPGAKDQHTSSSSKSKKEKTHGYSLGCFAALGPDWRSIPLSMRCQGGKNDPIEAMLDGKDIDMSKYPDILIEEGLPLNQRLLNDIFYTAELLGESKLLTILDRNFPSAQLFQTLKEHNERVEAGTDPNCTCYVDLLCRFRNDTAGYELLTDEYLKQYEHKPGPKPTKGPRLSFRDLYELRPELFKEVKITTYGVEQDYKYFGKNLLWGENLEELLFVASVWIDQKGKEHYMVLGTNRLDLDPVLAIELYAYRFRIEQLFKDDKQDYNLGGGRHYSRKNPEYTSVREELLKRYVDINKAKDIESILDAFLAREVYVFMTNLALALSYYLCYAFEGRGCELHTLYTRKDKKDPKVTISMVRQHLRLLYFSFLSSESEVTDLRYYLIEQLFGGKIKHTGGDKKAFDEKFEYERDLFS